MEVLDGAVREAGFVWGWVRKRGDSGIPRLQLGMTLRAAGGDPSAEAGEKQGGAVGEYDEEEKQGEAGGNDADRGVGENDEDGITEEKQRAEEQNWTVHQQDGDDDEFPLFTVAFLIRHRKIGGYFQIPSSFNGHISTFLHDTLAFGS